MNNLLKIKPEKEVDRIISFIKSTLKKQGFKNVVIGVSGGVDSTICLYLLKKAIPPENIFPICLPYFNSQTNLFKDFIKETNIPKNNAYYIPIRNVVDKFQKTLEAMKHSKNYKVRLGNIMARTRMTLLYDLAKKHNALVCGTENKSEFYLGYFTRFGDEASDFEPIRHLYKTQVYQLARHLKIAPEIINSPPTAGLWPGQTDEKELGFSYEEADQVLNLYFDQKKSLSEILSKNFPDAKKIIAHATKNSFKHHLPYVIK